MVPSILKPLAILFFIFLFQQLSGGYVVIFYAIQVFQIVGGNFEEDFDEYDILVFMGLIRCVLFLNSLTYATYIKQYTSIYVVLYPTYCIIELKALLLLWEKNYTNNKLFEFLWLSVFQQHHNSLSLNL